MIKCFPRWFVEGKSIQGWILQQAMFEYTVGYHILIGNKCPLWSSGSCSGVHRIDAPQSLSTPPHHVGDGPSFNAASGVKGLAPKLKWTSWRNCIPVLRCASDASGSAARKSASQGPSTLGHVADLTTLAQGSKADLLCKICESIQRVIKENQAGPWWAVYITWMFMWYITTISDCDSNREKWKDSNTLMASSWQGKSDPRSEACCIFKVVSGRNTSGKRDTLW